MSSLTFWFDVETTGLNPKIHGLTELAFLIERNGKILEEREFKIKPLRTTVVDQKALEIQGITCDDLDRYIPVRAVYNELVLCLKAYVKAYDKYDKFVQGAYNAGFDHEFLKAMFTSQGDKYYFSWFYPARIDVMSLVGMYLTKKRPMLPDLKLGTLCKHFDIAIDAHKALSDIRATRKLYYKLISAVHPQLYKEAE